MTTTNPLARYMTERELQANVVRLARTLGYRVYHTWLSVHSAAGWPDVVACKPPRLVLAELKREGKEPTPAQAEWLTALAASGIETHVWHPADWLDGTIERVLKGETP